MQYFNNTANKPEDHWRQITLCQELTELKREREHLQSKSQERTLNSWEVSRLESLVSEVKAVTQQLAAFGKPTIERVK